MIGSFVMAVPLKYILLAAASCYLDLNLSRHLRLCYAEMVKFFVETTIPSYLVARPALQ